MRTVALLIVLGVVVVIALVRSRNEARRLEREIERLRRRRFPGREWRG